MPPEDAGMAAEQKWRTQKGLPKSPRLNVFGGYERGHSDTVGYRTQPPPRSMAKSWKQEGLDRHREIRQGADTFGCGSKMLTQNGALVNETKD